VFFEIGRIGVPVLWFSDIPGLLRSAGLKTSGLPLLWHLLSISVLQLRLDCYARKSYYACCVVQGLVGTWITIPCWHSIHLPIVNLVDHVDAHSSPFFLLSSFVLVIGFTRWRSWGMFVLLGLIRLVHLICIFIFYTLLGCTWVRFYVPLISISHFLIF